MGAFHTSRIELVTTLSEIVGYKAGIALTRVELSDHLDPEDRDLINRGDDEAMMRVRSEEFEELVCTLLHAVGNISSPSMMPIHMRLFGEYRKSKRSLAIYDGVVDLWTDFLRSEMDIAEKSQRRTLDPTGFIVAAMTKYGRAGVKLAVKLVEGFDEDLHKSTLSHFRRVEWKDEAELQALFDSEDLKTPHGKFFDQRFVDYLSQNFSSIDNINWRKFEGLTCEFFHQCGFHVDPGKGRNDDGIDVRVWSDKASAGGSPLILVHCKRERRQVGKVIVKALNDDVRYAKAKSGLIVTTTALAPGARKVCIARQYPIREANRETLKQWIAAMRTPFAGVFLGL